MENNMKNSFLIISLAIIVLAGLFGGCSHDVKGPARVNISPTVKFTNIPVERARFSSDTTIYWYGTDVDGYIIHFRYTVVESTIVIDPETFIDEDGTGFIIPDSEVSWVIKEVDLDQNLIGTNDRVRMSADVADPVRKYVASYVFLQAVDNLGAESQIVYRAFLKNNHFPETDIGTNRLIDPYINAVSPNGILEGVVLTFSGSDPIDYRLGDEPPFQYRWKILGPYTQAQLAEIRSQYVDSVFMDTYGDLYRKGESLFVFTGLDTTIDSSVIPYDTAIDSSFNKFLVDNLRGSNPYGRWNGVLLGIDGHLDSMVVDPDDLGNLDNLLLFDTTIVDSSSDWTYSQSAQLFDIFRNQDVTPESDTTRQMYFVAWCQARDDANVPDKIPAFEYFTAIEPKFEREVLVIDYGSYLRASTQNFPVFPPVVPFRGRPQYADSFMVRNIFAEYINYWKPGSFDAVNVFNDTVINGFTIRYFRNGNTQDYFTLRQLYEDDTTKAMTLRDILKHKIMILVKDETDGSVELQSDIGSYIVDGINAGMSCWIMARAGVGAGLYEDGGVPLMPEVLATYFGVEETHTDDWQRRTQSRIPGFQPRIEDFQGAMPISGIDLPILAIDTVRLENRYLWDTAYPQYFYPFRKPLVMDTIDTNIYGEDTVYVFRLANYSGKQCAGGNDSGHAALPEVGYIVRSYDATPLYLYYSTWEKFGISRPTYVTRKEGTVIAVRYDHPVFRTAYFPFTVLPLEPVSGREMFGKMLDWLSEQPYIQTGKVRATGPFGSGLNKELYREQSRRLRELSSQGLLEILGTSAR